MTTTAAEPMQIQTANALITGAPADDDQLQAARAHFRTLSEMLTVSGPRFANAARDAAGLHNTAIRRLREADQERRRRAARQADADAGLNEIEV